MDRVRQAASQVVTELIWSGELELDAAMSLRGYLSTEELSQKQITESVKLFLPASQADVVLQRMQLKLDEFESKGELLHYRA